MTADEKHTEAPGVRSELRARPPVPWRARTGPGGASRGSQLTGLRAPPDPGCAEGSALNAVRLRPPDAAWMPLGK